MDLLEPIVAVAILGLIYSTIGALWRLRGELAMLFTLGASLAAIVAFHYIEPRLLGFIVALFIAFAWLSRGARQGAGASLLFALYLLIWFIYKYPNDLAAFVPALHPVSARLTDIIKPFGFLGVSYVGFKLIHFYVDRRDGKHADATVLSVVAWLLFVPSLVGGPIHRYQEWRRDWPLASDVENNIAEGTKRIIVGLFKVTVVGASISGLSIAGLTDYQLSSVGIGTLALGIVAYTVSLYFNFAGYTDIAIGIGRYWNQSLPENFNFPFFRRNLQEFWKNWHMSLIDFLREYVFTRIVYSLSGKDFFSPKSLMPASIGLLATFLTAAVWHKFNVGYLLWGLTNAGGLIFLLFLQRTKAISRSKFMKWWTTSPIGYVVSVLLTFVFVNATCLFIALSDMRLAILFNRLRS